MKTLDIDGVKVPLSAYAIQGNAVLGIRGSGKSYSSTWLAEQMLEDGVPFIAIDPTGIWRFLKVPQKPGGKAYKIVVAGGETPDLPLYPAMAPELVRSAMKSNIPMVLDLYDIKLSKADRCRIVEQVMHILLYENKPHGLRHIFLEEAAEYAPQNILPDQTKVYAAVEAVARMGGNSFLGFTLINQRSEQVNKAILELCDDLYLFRQRGKRSLESIDKWLSLINPETRKEVIKSLPNLPCGQCWICRPDAGEPRLVHMPAKVTLHPDRNKPENIAQAGKAVDVHDFVSQLKGSLEKIMLETKANDPAELKKRIRELEKELKTRPAEVKEVPVLEPEMMKDLEHRIAQWSVVLDKLNPFVTAARGVSAALDQLRVILALIDSPVKFNTGKSDFSVRRPPLIKRIVPPPRDNRTVEDMLGGEVKLEAGLRRMLTVLAQCPDRGLPRNKIAVRAGMSESGTFNTYLSKAKTCGWVQDSNGVVELTKEGATRLGKFEELPTGRALAEWWMRKLTAGEQRILEAVMSAHPHSCSAEQVQEIAELANSGTFNTYISHLKTLDLISGSRAALHASDSLFD